MGISLNLDNWLASNGYVHKNTKSFGTLKNITTDYEIYLKCVATMKVLGVQIDKKSKTYYIGTVKTFNAKQINDKVVTSTVLSYVSGSGGYYDDTLEDFLGGKKMSLGG